ncbi:hypothetical protein BV898_19397 [Hypsibius exemplaris]|uniref:Uncharacterized protein n=1 Tax=Hypsibius exemplaris TaxID=2072580 RepID=A0A9X6RPE8_HYPEX|nr:hypothetical protein BV898_19397 [Hypsibius exemplaris]
MLTEYSSPFNTKAAMKPEMLEEIATRIGEREPHPDFHDYEYAICIDEMKISGRKVFIADRLYGSPAVGWKIITDNAIQNQHVFRNHLVRDPVALLQDYDCRLDIEGNKEIDWHPDAMHGIKNILLRGSGFTAGIFNIDLVRRLWRKEQYTVTSARLAPCLSAIVVQPAEIERQKVWPAVKVYHISCKDDISCRGDVEFKNAPVVSFFSMISKFWSIVNGDVKNGDGSVEWLKDTWLPLYRKLCRAKPVDPKIRTKIITDDTRDSIPVTTASTIRTLDYL